MAAFTEVAEATGLYEVADTVSADDILTMAARIAEQRLARGVEITSPESAGQLLQVRYAALEHEVFGVLWLDSQHRIIEEQVLFTGTINGASVYPREVVKAALACNAARCMFFHNHPGGKPEPSQADKMLTGRLQRALELIDVQVLDHFVVAYEGYVSFAERGML